MSEVFKPPSVPVLGSAAVSPTGVPVLAPKFIPVLTAVWGALMAVAGFFAATKPHTFVGQYGLQVGGAIGSFIGIASPGARKNQ